MESGQGPQPLTGWVPVGCHSMSLNLILLTYKVETIMLLQTAVWTKHNSDCRSPLWTGKMQASILPLREQRNGRGGGRQRQAGPSGWQSACSLGPRP